MNATNLEVFSFETREEMGQAAGREVVRRLREAIETKGSARLMLAAAPSQLDTLGTVIRSGLDFTNVVCFHMDDYIGLSTDAPQAFGNWLEKNFISQVSGTPTFHRIDATLPPEEAARAYAERMGEEPFDVTMCGLGVNAHIAFNDPPANFDDPDPARVVVLDQVSRQQQVDEGHFPMLDDVPTHAITVTIPRLLNAAHVVCSVPGAEKRQAVAATLAADGLDPMVPGTALTRHPRAGLYLDAASDPR